MTSLALPPALSPMAAYPQWICWQLVQRSGKRKADKIPSDPHTRFPIDAQDPSWWMDSATALRVVAETGLGLGFVFTERDPFFFLDVDECATPEGPRPWSDLAYHLQSLLPRAAAETSCSGRGLHFFGRCPTGFPEHSNRNSALGIEFYTSKRFVALGTGAVGDAGADCTIGVREIVSRYFPPGADLLGEWTTEPREGCGIDDDEDLVRRACAVFSVGSAFGTRAGFRDLWEANELALCVAYPDPVRAYDASAADMALASHLAFWTGGNCEQVERLMLASGLHRDKWDVRDDYLKRTVMKAVGGAEQFYRRPAAEAQALGLAPPPPGPQASPVDERHVVPNPSPQASGDSPAQILSHPFVDRVHLEQLWKDYVYVVSLNRVLTPKGELWDAERFRNKFGGKEFAFDVHNKMTPDAWKAFAHSQVVSFPKADHLCFRPLESRTVIQEGDNLLANSWKDPRPTRAAGDPSPMLRHVKRILPNGDDAEILLSYLAACVQHQGRKFMWAPLVQGVQGNGKSVLANIVEHAVGEKYVHWMSGEDLHARFNGWMQGHVFVVVEDMFMGGRRDMTPEAAIERAKPLITARRMQVERKRVDQVTEEVCCNFFFTSNRKDAIPLDPNERRWAVFFCAQQSKRDLARAGFDDVYFDELWGWLRGGGYAVCAEHLWTMAIPDEYNPATHCNTAPDTSSRHEAIEASRSPEAQYLREAIADERPGFKGGWVSSLAAIAWLREQHLRVSPQRLSAVLGELNYVKHPGLDSGRSPRHVAIESGKPRLWVLDGHSTWALQGLEIVDAFERAQGYDNTGVVTAFRR